MTKVTMDYPIRALQRMCLQPQRTSGGGWIDAHLVPPTLFVAVTMHLAVMSTTERDGELVH